MNNQKQFFMTLILILTGMLILTTGDFQSILVSAAPESDILPEIVEFNLSPASIEAGSSAVLSWNVRGASIVSIDQHIGGVTPTGQIQVNPSYTLTYKITAINEWGVRGRYITLTVTNMQAGDMVNYDPVTGRSAEVDLSWEQLCLSKQYQVQIARDPGFTLIVYDPIIMEPADLTSPAFWYAPGMFEAGHTYYWRVRTRQAATGQYVISPWSEVKSFTVRPGFPVRSDYYGISALNPSSGCWSCPIKPVSFSWSGYQGTTKYRFILARDHELQNIVVEAVVPTTAFSLNDPLEYGQSYFWQVTAIEPIPSDPSSVFTFQTESVPQPATQQKPVSTDTPGWAWAVMIIGGLLTVFVIFLAVRSGYNK